METVPEVWGLDLGRRLVIICTFLFVLWFSLNYLVMKIKSGKLKVPEFLSKKVKILESLQKQANNSQIHSIDIVQRHSYPDGLEILVLDVDERRLLLGRTLQGGLSYITELEKPSLQDFLAEKK